MEAVKIALKSYRDVLKIRWRMGGKLQEIQAELKASKSINPDTGKAWRWMDYYSQILGLKQARLNEMTRLAKNFDSESDLDEYNSVADAIDTFA